MDCIFCKIVKKETPSYTVYEDDNFVGLLDINPLNRGHTLVIPKKHYRWVWDVPNIGAYFETVQKIAKAQQQAFGTEWVVSLVIGEEVPHAHVSLIPRFDGDGHGGSINFSPQKEFSEQEFSSFAEKIRKALRG